MNRYTHKFKSRCPVNGKRIKYRLEVTSDDIISVEKIVAACRIEEGLHEDIATALQSALGGKHVLIAMHHGVRIETRRG